MSDADTQTILAEVAELKKLVREGFVPKPVLTLAEAMDLTNHGSGSAFGRWCSALKVKACGQGRYARRAILAGLEREADSGGRRRRSPKKKEKANP